MGRKKKAVKTVTASVPKTRRNAKINPIVAQPPIVNANTTNSETGSQDCSENESQDSNSLTSISTSSMSHKNFGKYRYLAEKNSQRSMLYSDCDVGNNVEVKVVDPCASSESDNSNSIEMLNSMNCFNMADAPMLRSFSKINRSDRSSDSGSPISFKLLKSKLIEKINSNSNNKVDNENQITLSSVSYDTQLPDPTLNLIACNDPRRSFKSALDNYSNILGEFSPTCKSDMDSSNAVDGFTDNYESEIVIEDKISNGDEEMYTVFEIVDENVAENDPDSLNVDLFSSPRSQMPDNPVDNTPISISASSSFSHVKESEEDMPPTSDIYDFERKISNIKLSDTFSNLETDSIINFPDNYSNVSVGTSSSLIANKSSVVLDERKIDESTNASESCSTPTSMVSEDDTHVINKVEVEMANVEKTEPLSNYSTDSNSSSSVSGVRRSNRIKTINVLKQRSKGHGLVKVPRKSSVSLLVKDVAKKNLENSIDNITKPSSDKSTTVLSVSTPQCSPIFPVPTSDTEIRPVKVKSRWRRSSEIEFGSRSPITPPLSSPNTLYVTGSKISSTSEGSVSGNCQVSNDSTVSSEKPKESVEDKAVQDRLAQFQTILENEYHCDRAVSREARKMTCDCFLTKEEVKDGELGCGEDCLNRLLMIECNTRCPVGNRCTNRRFQSNQYSELRVIKTEKKGLGIEAVHDISRGEFLMEYVGEVLNWKQFNQRAQEYSSDNNTHHYFMSLKSDAVIDATLKGNISRFINHSCDPNAETQKWTVNGVLRIGFFSKKDIKAGDEITFDYQFQRYGKEGLRCFCESSNCRGWIGEEPDSEDEEEEEEDESETVEDDNTVEVEIPVEDENKEPLVGEPKVDTEEVQEITEVKVQAPVRRRRIKRNSFVSRKNELLQDMDLEEEMNMLYGSGIKNQSHTLALCRAMVRAKQIEARISLLQLLASADLPCRRLFLDYRGLRLLAPWCEDVNEYIRLEILIALEKLPIPNKTILKECKILSTVEKWLSDSTVKDDSSDDSRPSTPVFIDESTGLPVENMTKFNKTDSTASSHESEDVKKQYSIVTQENINKLSKQLIERWAGLQEIFKIPKKERIELMKEHERQANELPSEDAKDKEPSEEERWEERYNRHDREKKLKILTITEIPRRNTIRLDDRVLAAIPPMSKEERRREFAARAAHQEQMRRAQAFPQPIPTIAVDASKASSSHWGQNSDHVQNYGNVLVNGAHGIPTPSEYVVSEYMQVDYTNTDFVQTNNYQYPYCANQQVYPISPLTSTMPPPPVASAYNLNPNYTTTPYQNASFVNTPLVPPLSPYQTIPLSSSIPQSNNTIIGVVPPQPIPTLTSPIGNQPIPTVIALQATPKVQNQMTNLNPQPIPSLVPAATSPFPIPTNNIPQNVTMPYYKPTVAVDANVYQNRETRLTKPLTVTTFHREDSHDMNAEVVPFTPVRLPSRWRSMKDARGRTYYYHVKHRIPQWEPPLYSPTLRDDDDSSMDEQEQVSEDENKEMMMDENYVAMKEKLVEGVNGIYQVRKGGDRHKKNGIKKKQLYFSSKVKKLRPGLVTERIISPRLEEDKINAKIDLRRYKETKEKLRKRKELVLMANSLNKYKKKSKSSKHKKVKEPETETEIGEKAARRIKETFRATMARVMVHHLDPYRRDDCLIGRITNTADFKHLARKLTHFVMLKELKHCQSVNDLECNDSVKQKAKEFVKKYMAKYGPVYQRPPDEVDC